MLFTARDIYRHSESFMIQLASVYLHGLLFTSYFLATPPCIVANSALWLAALYSWRDRDVTFREISHYSLVKGNSQQGNN